MGPSGSLFVYFLFYGSIVDFHITLASTVQQSDSKLYHIFFFCVFFSITGYLSLLEIVPCAVPLGPYMGPLILIKPNVVQVLPF